MNKSKIEAAYLLAKEQYATLGVDTDHVIDQMSEIIISLHCWQADDVGGFETPDSKLSGGGIQVTGNYPGKARNINELKADLEKVMSLCPGKQRLNLHAIYGDFGGHFVDRDQIEPSHFQTWIDWALQMGIGLDFNCTCFSHPKANDGFTLSSNNVEIRKFWIEHVKRCRKIAAHMGKMLGTTCIHNIWIPDGSKDIPVDRYTHRKILKDSLDEIFSVQYPSEYIQDSVESKLFGIGSEAMVVGSHEFYLGYAIRNQLLVCLDSGHFHPTEEIGDKISSCLVYLDKILLHVTRGMRWDSDHVVNLEDDILNIAHEIVRCNAIKQVRIGLDYFDASINRIGAYVIGTRATQMAMMQALLEPIPLIRTHEENARYFERMALLEQMKIMPMGAVWEYYCMLNKVAQTNELIPEIQAYEMSMFGTR